MQLFRIAIDPGHGDRDPGAVAVDLQVEFKRDF